MPWRWLSIALLLLPIACGGVVRQEFGGVGQPAPPGFGGQPPDLPTMLVRSGEGEVVRVEAFSWASAQGSAGGGSRTPELWLIHSSESSLTLELPYQAVAVLLTQDDHSTAVDAQALGNGQYRVDLPLAGVWQVDVLALSGGNYATFSFTVDAG